MVAYVEAQKEAGKDYTQDATLLWGTTGGTVLKEMHRFASSGLVNSISPRYMEVSRRTWNPSVDFCVLIWMSSPIFRPMAPPTSLALQRALVAESSLTQTVGMLNGLSHL